jgi:4a-hydroxytetrahydrobiopterin dehydratase
MALMSQTAVNARLKNLKGWKLIDKKIQKVFKHAGFIEAMGFVTSVALVAERANHHPDIDVRWNLVTITLTTHSDGGVTEKDIALASEIEKL